MTNAWDTFPPLASYAMYYIYVYYRAYVDITAASIHQSSGETELASSGGEGGSYIDIGSIVAT